MQKATQTRPIFLHKIIVQGNSGGRAVRKINITCDPVCLWINLLYNKQLPDQYETVGAQKHIRQIPRYGLRRKHCTV